MADIANKDKNPKLLLDVSFKLIEPLLFCSSPQPTLPQGIRKRSKVKSCVTPNLSELETDTASVDVLCAHDQWSIEIRESLAHTGRPNYPF